MRRDLFFHERFLSAGGKRPWNVILVARLRSRVDAAAARAVLDEMQAHHPALRAVVVRFPGLRPRFETPWPTPPVSIRIVPRAGADTWFREVIVELERAFDDEGPLLRVVLVDGEDACDAILIADHCICDGRSMLLLMREFTEGLTSARPARIPQRSIDSVRDLFPASCRARPGPLRHLAHMGWLARRATATAEMWRSPRPPPRPAYVLRREMAPGEFDALTVRSRSEGVTAYSALATAFLRAVRSTRPDGFRNRLLCPVDVRSGIPGIGPDTLFGYPETVALSVRRRLDSDFWSQVRTLRREFLEAKARLDPGRTLLAAERLHGLSDWFVSLQMHGRARNDLMFSHLGDADLETSRVEAVLAFLSSMPWRGTIAVFSLVDRGVMRLFLVGRDDAMAQGEATRVMDDAMTRVASVLTKPAVSTYRKT